MGILVQQAAANAVGQKNGHGANFHAGIGPVLRHDVQEFFQIRLDDRQHLLPNGPANCAVHFPFVMGAKFLHLFVKVVEKAQQGLIGSLPGSVGDLLKIPAVGGEKIRHDSVKKLVLGFEIIIERAHVQPDFPHDGANARAVEAVFKEHPPTHFQNFVFGTALDLLSARHRTPSRKTFLPPDDSMSEWRNQALF